MPAKHRKSSRPAAVLAAVVAPGGLAAAAVAATSLSTAVVTGTTTAAAPSVELVALITPANSTAQIFAGTTYYNNTWTEEDIADFYGEQQVVPFFLGPQGIANAISDADGEPIAVLASGWGAGQTGTALGILAGNPNTTADDDPALDDMDLVILDNNSNRGGGGFWTTYSAFAPLLFTSAEPTPSNLGVPVLDVAYEYNINSSAPVDPLNPFALGNSLAAYVYGYGGEQTAPVPQEAIDDAKGLDDYPDIHYHYIVDSEGNVIDRIELEGSTTTYVTFESGDLPLLRPLRLIPGGDIVADALQPTFTELVNAGYNDGLGVEGDEAIPVDPRTPRPMKPGSSLTGLGDLAGSAQDGLDEGVDTAKDDVSNPGNFVTKPLGEAGKLPFVSTLTNATSAPNIFTTNGTNKVSPSLNKPGATSSTGSQRPLKKIADDFNSSLKNFASGLQKNKADNEPSSPKPKAP